MAVNQTKSGRWYVQYRVPGLSSPKKDYLGNNPDAQEQALKRQAEIATGHIYTVAALSNFRQIYLDDLGQCYLDFLKIKDKTTSWIGTLKYLLNEHFLPVLCHSPVDQISFTDILKVAARFADKSAATQNRYMDSLHVIFRFGIRHELTTNDPMAHWQKKREPQRNMLLTIKDLAKIYAAAPDHLKWIIEVEWALGTRPGKSELFSLCWQDVDFDNNFIRVRGTKTKGSDRIIPLTPEFKARLLDKRDVAQSPYIIEVNGRGIQHCRRAFKTALEKAKIDYPVRLYDIRHLFASTMLANGGDLKAVSKLLGHSSTRMTADTYYHELQGEKERALSAKPQLF
uniref:Integrase family protein n=1 Tax=Desulfovibrio desulfuricans (strain ATCC 27774 / DSM 6949 / MB) TaxID=525146 RepID=B8J487_DESDA